MADHHNSISKSYDGLKVGNKNQPVIFTFGGEAWPSDDSTDSDFVLKSNMAQRNRLDDSAIEGDSSGYEEKSDISQCMPSDGQESQDSGTEVKTIVEGKLEEKLEQVPQVNNHLKTHSKGVSHQNWVISAPIGDNSDKGIMTIKFKLGDKVNSKRGRKRKNPVAGGEVKAKVKKVRIKKETTRSPKKKKGKTVCFVGESDIPEIKCESELDLQQYDNRWSERLPKEILLKIFQYSITREGHYNFVKRASEVCRLWEDVATCRSLWINVDFSTAYYNNRHMSELVVQKLCQQFMSQTEEVNFSGWEKNLTAFGIKAVAENCPKLKSIILHRCSKITSDSVKLLIDSCPSLSSIDLSAAAQNSAANSPVSIPCLKYLFEKCGHQLKALVLAENKVNNFLPAFKGIAEFCPELRVLDVSVLQSTSSLVLPLELLQKGCPKLKVLRLANSNIALAPASLSLQAKAPGFPELEELSIAVTKDYSSWLGDNDLERLVKTSHKLKLLDVRGCRSISVSGLVKVPAWDIEHLHLSQCAATKTTDLELILKKWNHSLKEVDLSWANNADAIDPGVISLSNTEGQSNLEILDVCGSAISLYSVRCILEKCKRLYSLNLQSCRALPRGIKRLYVGDDLDRLREELSDGKYDDNAATVAKSEN